MRAIAANQNEACVRNRRQHQRNRFEEIERALAPFKPTQEHDVYF